MAFTGTQGIETKIQSLKAENLQFKENSLPINFNVDINDTTTSKIASLEEKIQLLEQKLEEQKSFVNILTGTILPYAKDAIDFASNAFLPPPHSYEWCFGQIVSKTDEKYANLYSVIGNRWNTSDTLTEDQFQLPDLRNVFLRGCPEYIEGSENNRFVGNFQACGAPNITGQGLSDIDRGQFNLVSGAFLKTTSATKVMHWPNRNDPAYAIGIDASRSSSVYQDSLTEVRPDNKTVNYIIKL